MDKKESRTFFSSKHIPDVIKKEIQKYSSFPNCKELTKDGDNCYRSWNYTYKDNKVDCSSYCVDKCDSKNSWIGKILDNIPKTVQLKVDNSLINAKVIDYMIQFETKDEDGYLKVIKEKNGDFTLIYEFAPDAPDSDSYSEETFDRGNAIQQICKELERFVYMKLFLDTEVSNIQITSKSNFEVIGFGGIGNRWFKGFDGWKIELQESFNQDENKSEYFNSRIFIENNYYIPQK